MPSESSGSCIHHLFNPKILGGRRRLDAKTANSFVVSVLNTAEMWVVSFQISKARIAMLLLYYFFFSHATEKLNVVLLYFMFLNHLLTHLDYLDSRVWLLIVVHWRLKLLTACHQGSCRSDLNKQVCSCLFLKKNVMTE